MSTVPSWTRVAFAYPLADVVLLLEDRLQKRSHAIQPYKGAAQS